MSEVASSAIAYLSDRETAVDFLNNEAIAKTIIRLILEKSDSPITIGVHGDWGAGKSSVLEMTHDGLSKEKDILCLRFNGWQFQGFEDAKIALIERVVEGLIEKKSLLTKAKDEVEEVLKSIDWMKAAKKGGQFAATALTGLPFFDLGDVYDTIVDKISGVFQDEEQRKAALEEIEKLKKEKSEKAPSSHSIPKEIGAFRKSFKKLIAKAELKRLVVLIDDLDRCLPKTAVETLEAVRLFVLLDKTAFVVGADERMIEYAVAHHFPNLPERTDGQSYAQSYLEKLIQVPFRIPALGDTETKIYVTLLLLGAALGNEQEKFEKLLTLGRTALGRPWEGDGLKDEDIKAVLADQYEALQQALITAEQISPVLSAGTKGNPRQIKRFLNALTLRLAVANERGFGDAIEQTRLAKLMLAEMFLPDTFPAIATFAAHSPDGKCRELAALEAFVSGKLTLSPTAESAEGGEPGAEKGGAIPQAADDLKETLTEWVSRSEVIKWAKIKPDLGETSLRPYLFVIKDRKNYLGGEAPLTQAQAALVARLASGPLVAAGADADVKKLPPPDLDAIFKALRGQVLTSSSFDAKPPALVGLEAMVKALPPLQGRYLDVLEALPSRRLGIWAATGFNQIITNEEPKARLKALTEKWQRDGGEPLKRVLANAQKPVIRSRGA